MSEAEPGLGESQPAGLDAIISSAIDKSSLAEEPKATEAPVDTPAEPVEPKADHPTDPTRYADGTFKKTKSAEATPSDKEPAATAKAEPIKDAEPPKQEPIQPHARWDEALKTQFATWPRDVQQAFLDRHNAFEGDYTRKTQEIAETRKALEPLQGEFQRLNPLLQQMGMTPQQFIAESGAVASNLLSGNPAQRANAIAYLVQHRQIPIPEVLNALGIPIPQGGEGVQVRTPDPAYTQLHQQVSGLQQQLQQVVTQRQLEERQRAQAEFDALGQTKDQNGQPKYPHFQRVSQAMIQLVASGQADTWDAAYDKAVWGEPELRQAQIEAERQRVLADAEKQRLEAIEKAKKAAPVKSSDGAPKGGQQVKGIDAHLNAALERAGF